MNKTITGMMVIFYFHIMMNIKLCEHVTFGSSDTPRKHCKGCYHEACMDVVMFGPRKDWGSEKGAITENACMSADNKYLNV